MNLTDLISFFTDKKNKNTKAIHNYNRSDTKLTSAKKLFEEEEIGNEIANSNTL